MKIYVPSMLAKGVETINKHNRQAAIMANKNSYNIATMA